MDEHDGSARREAQNEEANRTSAKRKAVSPPPGITGPTSVKREEASQPQADDSTELERGWKDVKNTLRQMARESKQPQFESVAESTLATVFTKSLNGGLAGQYNFHMESRTKLLVTLNEAKLIASPVGIDPLWLSMMDRFNAIAIELTVVEGREVGYKYARAIHHIETLSLCHWLSHVLSSFRNGIKPVSTFYIPEPLSGPNFVFVLTDDRRRVTFCSVRLERGAVSDDDLFELFDKARLYKSHSDKNRSGDRHLEALREEIKKCHEVGVVRFLTLLVCPNRNKGAPERFYEEAARFRNKDMTDEEDRSTCVAPDTPVLEFFLLLTKDMVKHSVHSLFPELLEE